MIFLIFTSFSLYFLNKKVNEHKFVLNELLINVNNLTSKDLEVEEIINLLTDFAFDIENRTSLLETEFSSTIKQQKEELEVLTEEFSGLETQLESYFDWFEDNSILSPPLDKELATIEDCVDGRIRLPCLWFRNERVFDIEYLNDIELGKADFIQNISFTIDREGGDCEDLATLFMAEANYLYQKYGRFFEGWKQASDGKYHVVGDLYLQEARYVEIPKTKVYVVCYSAGPTGHCINAFCDNDLVEEIKQGENIDTIMSQCILVEPQNYAEVIYVDGNSIGSTNFRGYFNYWMLFMSSEDLCMDVEGEWKCFSNFHERVQDSLNSLSNIININ